MENKQTIIKEINLCTDLETKLNLFRNPADHILRILILAFFSYIREISKDLR